MEIHKTVRERANELLRPGEPAGQRRQHAERDDAHELRGHHARHHPGKSWVGEI